MSKTMTSGIQAAELLRVRIAALDTEIGLQIKLLKKLEADKSLAQRQLNANFDPVARLPLEISSDIFLQTLVPFPEHGAQPHIPMTLLSICNTWTDIALATPALWATVDIVFPCAPGFKKVLPIWFERAHNRPLSISLSGHKYDQDVISVIGEHGRQLKHLEIDPVGTGLGSPGSMPSLETLATRATKHGWLLHGFKLLRMAPNLIECLFYNMEDLDDLVHNPSEKLVLPNLRRLMFSESGAYPEVGTELISCLSLPGLETLSISLSDEDPIDDLLSFLQQSSPPLLELVLGATADFPPLVECLRLVPDLRTFELWYPQFWVAEDLLGALAESPSLLPCLHTLVIHPESESAVPRFFWTALLNALTARRTNLKVFHLVVDDWAPMPPPDVISVFRELTVGGTRVHRRTHSPPSDHVFE
ncbi:hypothetical protein B0H14DRAFT_2779983 [Mycena olivaceomarginata]|nr:hypothetical protein B0H14DRAFT_2779983 [Mycena olivaceomarginata]